MEEKLEIKTAAVLGAGVMGAQIAAHLVNCGIKTILYDLPSGNQNRDFLAKNAVASLLKLKPAPFLDQDLAVHIRSANFEDDLKLLIDCDFVIEVIAEHMDWKQALFDKITPHLHPKAILATNTSGLSIERLKERLAPSLWPRFLGVHFFNPPRYMYLVELIPHASTDPNLRSSLETWLVRYLGKGVVIARDTPNFIGNRIGVFALLSALWNAEKFELSPDTVDALTGPLLRRSSSATFRTMDIVGLDTLSHVVQTMAKELATDPWHVHFRLPEWIQQLIEKGLFGQKTKAGVFKKEGDQLLVFQLQSQQYRPVQKRLDPEIQAIFETEDLSSQFTRLIASEKREAKFLQAVLADLFHYSAYHAFEIAHSVRDIDCAMCWGYGWELGPFETWQRIGIPSVLAWLKQLIATKQTLSNAPLPAWLMSLDPKAGFYEREVSQPSLKGTIILETPNVQLRCLGEIGIVQLKTKGNTFNRGAIEGLLEVLDLASTQLKGLVIGPGEGHDFSFGADLKEVLQALQERKPLLVEQRVNDFQYLMQRLQIAPIPVVAALKGCVLGEGTELALHCYACVAHFETYMGLVETTVGLLPAGGGCKELWRRLSKRHALHLDHALLTAFDTISTAKVSGSALEAKTMGLLRESDLIIPQGEELLLTAVKLANFLADTAFSAPLLEPIIALGKNRAAPLLARLANERDSGLITEHQYFVREKVVQVLSGGSFEAGSRLPDPYWFQLELQAFMTLLNTQATGSSIRHALEK